MHFFRHFVFLNTFYCPFKRAYTVFSDDAGYDMVALHFSVNKQLHGVAAGDINVDITVKSGSVIQNLKCLS